MNGARLDTVCKYICERCGWSVSNLRLQKLLYLAQMHYMGQTKAPERLVDTNFEAWDYGPVSPELYSQIRNFGAEPIPKAMQDFAFPGARRFHDDDPRKQTLDEICDKFLSYSPGQLVNITHSPKGAWAKYYQPGVRDISIPDEAIRGEYYDRYPQE